MLTVRLCFIAITPAKTILFTARGSPSIFPALMTLRPWQIALAVCLLVSPAGAQPNEIRKSIARINNTAQEANYRAPWLPGAMSGGSGTGWVVASDRLLTNAHVVSNARFLTVEKENDPKKYIATVEHIAHDCDLAILKVQDPAFFKGTIPLSLGGIPELESTVKKMTDHVTANHPDVAKKMEEMHKSDPEKWGKEMKPKFEAAPETA